MLTFLGRGLQTNTGSSRFGVRIPTIGYSSLDFTGYRRNRSPATPPGRPASVGPPLIGLLHRSTPTHFKYRLHD